MMNEPRLSNNPANIIILICLLVVPSIPWLAAAAAPAASVDPAAAPITTTTATSSSAKLGHSPATQDKNDTYTQATSENATANHREHHHHHHHHHHSHLALMRLGSQPPLESGGKTGSPEAETGAADQQQHQQHAHPQSGVAESRLDLAVQPQPTVKSSNVGLANHKDHQYPVEPYPSASYTNLVHSLAGPTISNTNSNVGNQLAQTDQQQQQQLLLASSIDALLNREHHSDLVGGGGGGTQLESYFNTNHIKNLDDNYAAASSTNSQQQQIYNHNYNQAKSSQLASSNNNRQQPASSSSSTSTLNAGLIQNLTASLFPVKQLTNSTLLSLSELLNKTRHQHQANQSASSTTPTPFISNAYRPPPSSSSLLLSSSSGGLLSNANNNNYGQQQFLHGDHSANRDANHLGGLQQPSLGPTTTSMLLNALFDDNQSNSNNLFDYFTRTNPNNQPQFGFREPNSRARFQANQNHNHPQRPALQAGPSQGAYTKTPSNIYNTYLPLKEALGQQASAASLYDSYLDQSGYKYPLSVNIAESTLTKQRDNNNNNFKHFNGQQPQQQQQQQSYQFVQNYNTNNGQQQHHHLDKIVYHSTPFRPSIVSPPAPPSMGNNNNNNSASWNKQSENKPYVSLLSADGSIGDGIGQTGGEGGGRVVNASRYPTTSSSQLNPFRQQVAPGTRLSANNEHHHHHHPHQQHMGFSYDGHQSTLNNTSDVAAINQLSEMLLLSTRNNSLNSPTTSATRQQTVGYHQPAHTTTSTTTGSGGSTASNVQQPVSTLTSGPQILFDIYEREIDNQIRDALYVDHYNHFSQQASQTSAIPPSLPGVQAAASNNPQTMWPFSTTEDNLDTNNIGQQLAAAAPPTSTWPTRPTLPPMIGGQAPSNAHLLQQPRPAASLLSQQALAPNGQQLGTTTYGGHTHQLTSPSGSISDPLVAALQELPTFSASDLQPIIPAGPAYSLVSPGAQNIDASPTEHSLAALASQLLPVNAQYSDLVSFLNDNEQSFGGGGSSNTGNTGKQASNSHQQHASSNNNAGNSGLPSILLKLNSGQISSILTSPLAHLYANLPRYRYKTKQQQYPNNQQQAAASSSSPVGSILAPNSIMSKQFWNVLSNSGQNTQLDANKLDPQLATMQTSFNNRQQAAAMAAATAAANWIAATGQSLTPLQAALIQAQAATSAYLGATNSVQVEPTTQGTSFATDSTSQQQQQQQQNPLLGSLMGGLAGGGISPLIWRSVLSPMHWARKQTSANQQTNQNGSLQASDSISNAQQTSKPLAFPFVSSLWAPTGGGAGGFGPFSSFASSSNQQTTASVPKSTSGSKSPKLKIKILKIPVAFYDNSPSATSPEINHLDGHHLMPAHLQPSPTASLLANMQCAYHNHYPLANPSIESGLPFPLAESQLFSHTNQLLGPRGLFSQMNKPTSSPKSMADSTTSSTPAQPLSTQATSSSSSSSSSSPSSSKKSEHDKSFQMQYFTDINQPNDLQVSPSTTVTTNSQERPTKLV